MNYRLSRKNQLGKWWTYGDFKKNQYGNYTASFKVEKLQELIELAKMEGKQWINLSAFEEKEQADDAPVPSRQARPHYKVTNDVAGINDDLDDEIPF
jgi:hypothetical protein